MSADRLANAHKGIAARVAGTLGAPRMGIVTSYNPNDGTAKVTIQPEGTQTGWLPVLSQSVGAGWGLHVPFKTGEQVLILPQEGNADHGIIVGRVFDDNHRPPASAGSDIVLKSSAGAIITLSSTGHIKMIDAAGSSYELTNDGNMTVTAPNTVFVHCQSFNVQASVGVTLQAPFTNVSNELDVGIGPIKQNGVTVIVP